MEELAELREKHQLFSVASERQLQMVALQRDRCREDLFFLCHDVLGLKAMCPRPQGDICHYLQNVQEGYLLAARDFMKTVIGRGKCIQQFIRNPNTALYLPSKTWGKARRNVAALRDFCENNQKLYTLFPDIFYHPSMGDKPTHSELGAFTVKRTMLGLQEPSVLAGGLEQQATGYHFDGIMPDDVNDDKDRNNPTTLTTCEEWIYQVKSLRRDPLTSWICFIGTRWDIADSYAYIKQNWKKATDLVVPASSEPFANGVATWPERYPLETLREIMVSGGRSNYALQYDLRVDLATEARIQGEWWKWYRWPDNNEKTRAWLQRLNIFIAVDPGASAAPKQQKRTGYTGILVAGVDHTGRKYILDAKLLRQRPMDVVDEIARLYEQWNPMMVAIEDESFQQLIVHMLEERHQGIPIRGVKMKREPNAFDNMVEVLSRDVRAGNWWLRVDTLSGESFQHTGCKQLLDEARRWTGSKTMTCTFDLLMAACILNQVTYVAESPYDENDAIAAYAGEMDWLGLGPRGLSDKLEELIIEGPRPGTATRRCRACGHEFVADAWVELALTGSSDIRCPVCRSPRAMRLTSHEFPDLQRLHEIETIQQQLEYNNTLWSNSTAELTGTW